MILLDTNAVIAILNNRPVSVRDHLRGALNAGVPVVTSSVVVYELWYGVARSQRRRENTERLRVFLSGDIDVIPFDDADAVKAGDLRAYLEAVGTPIGPYDLMIAAQALRLGATLITANTREYARVEGLTQEDWTVAG
jgi:tRNA(fMet)-specific endonuclease VapC